MRLVLVDLLDAYSRTLTFCEKLTDLFRREGESWYIGNPWWTWLDNSFFCMAEVK